MRVETPQLKEKLSEEDFWDKFAAVHATALGILCDAAAVALQQVTDAPVPPGVRMVDFAAFAARGEVVLGLEPEAFITAYTSNQETANDAVLEQSAVAVALMTFVSHQVDAWEGSFTDLLAALAPYASEQVKRSREWPASAKALGNALRRLIPHLRRAGITVKLPGRDASGRRLVSIFRTRK
jgi:hypothetical protein